jgi:hypothetical protein
LNEGDAIRVGVEFLLMVTQGSEFLATLGWMIPLGFSANVRQRSGTGVLVFNNQIFYEELDRLEACPTTFAEVYW